MTDNGGDELSTGWLSGQGAEADVVVSSRARLARNFASIPFLTKASHEQRRQAIELVRRCVEAGELGRAMTWINLDECDPLERNTLVERHLISKQHARGSEPRGVAIEVGSDRVAIMVNEEDHVRAQAMRAGLDLEAAFEDINAIDNALDERFPFAYSPRFGYLTACPTNVGTGLRLSVMIHLPGLKLTGEIEKMRRAAKAMNLAVRGFYGEGTEAVGDFYQLSNQTTLGKTEHEILHGFVKKVLPVTIGYERQARRALARQRKTSLEDKAHRALGVLCSARLLAADEAMQLLSALRLGVVMGIIEGIPLERVHHLMLLAQPAHLQKTVGERLTQAQRREARATLLRARLGG